MQAFKGKLQLNKKQKQEVDETILECVHLHNDILKLAFEQNAFPSYNSLGMFYSLCDAPASISQSQIKQTSQALERWLKKDVTGKRFGKPRFKTEKVKTNSFSFPIVNQKHIAKQGKTLRVYAPKLGWLKARISEREIEGKIKRVSIKCDTCGDYWIVIITDNVRKVELAPAVTKSLGVDLGIKTTVNASNSSGTVVVQPEKKEFLDAKNLQALKQASNKDRKALPFVHRKIKRRRDDYNWKLARKVVETAEDIYVGNVSPRWLMSGTLARKASDIALFDLKTKMSYLAASAGRHFEEINEAYTSKTCSDCGKVKNELKLSDRVFECSCGFVLDRDLNAARNICKKGEQLHLFVEAKANNCSAPQSHPFRVGS